MQSESQLENNCPICRHKLLQNVTKSPSGTMTIEKIYNPTEDKKDHITNIEIHLPPSPPELRQVYKSYKGMCISLVLPYNQDNSKGLVKRLKYTFQHGLLFRLKLNENYINRNDIRHRYEICHSSVWEYITERGFRLNVLTSYDQDDGSKMTMDIWRFKDNDRDIDKCHEILSEMNIPNTNTWWIPLDNN